MAEGEDRISSLPTHLLLEIISRIKIMDKFREKEQERLMSTKEVIQTTSTISKRWQHLWTRLPTLSFIHEDVLYSRRDRIVNYFSFITKTFTQCPTDVNLKIFKLQIPDVYQQPTLQVNRCIRYAITRNVQEIDIRITDGLGSHLSCDDDLFFNNSCLISIQISRFVFNPPNGAIRWDKLKFLHIDKGRLDEDLIGKIFSGSPCLETLEFNDCHLPGLIPKSLFENFGVLERLHGTIETYEGISYDDDELFLVGLWPVVSMKLSCCPNGAMRCDKLKFLCIDGSIFNEDSIEDIFSGSPFLETLQLIDCCGFSRIDVTSKSVKNLVLSGYGQMCHHDADCYIDTIEINAPSVLTLRIEGTMYLEYLLLENVSSLVKADFNYKVCYKFAREFLNRDASDIEEELLQGLLSSLGHVNEIALGSFSWLPQALSGLEAKGLQFRKGSDLRVFGSLNKCLGDFN